MKKQPKNIENDDEKLIGCTTYFPRTVLQLLQKKAKSNRRAVTAQNLIYVMEGLARNSNKKEVITLEDLPDLSEPKRTEQESSDVIPGLEKRKPVRD